MEMLATIIGAAVMSAVVLIMILSIVLQVQYGRPAILVLMLASAVITAFDWYAGSKALLPFFVSVLILVGVLFGATWLYRRFPRARVVMMVVGVLLLFLNEPYWYALALNKVATISLLTAWVLAVGLFARPEWPGSASPDLADRRQRRVKYDAWPE